MTISFPPIENARDAKVQSPDDNAATQPKAQHLRPSSQRYNIHVLTPKSDREAAHKHHRHAVYASETTGLLMIALVLLILTLIRYWREIHWSLR